MPHVFNEESTEKYHECGQMLDCRFNFCHETGSFHLATYRLFSIRDDYIEKENFSHVRQSGNPKRNTYFDRDIHSGLTNKYENCSNYHSLAAFVLLLTFSATSDFERASNSTSFSQFCSWNARNTKKRT